MQLVADGHHGLAAAERRQITARAARLGVEHHVFDRQVGRGAHGRTGQLRGDLVVHRNHVHVDHRLEMRLVALDLAGDAGHRLHRLHGEIAHGGLVAQHHGVHTLVNGAGHVAHLGARRTRGLDHRIEHLRGDDHGTLGADTLLDDTPLRVGNHLGGKLHAQVAAGDHDAVGSLDDLVDVVQSLLVLDFRDDLDVAAVGVENILHGPDVARRAHERMRDEIDVVLHGPFDEAAVLFGHRRQVDRHARHVDALARTHGASHDELAVQLRIVLAHDADFQLAVGDQHPRPDGNVAHDRRHVHVDHLAGREVRAVRTAHGHPVPRAEIDAVAVFVGDRRDTDFGSFGIYHNRNGRVHPVHRLDDMRGPVLGDVRRIDAHHVHTRVEKLFYELFGAAEIRHRSDNLGFFHAIHRAMFLRLYYPSIRSRAVLPPPLASFTSLSTPNPSPERT